MDGAFTPMNAGKHWSLRNEIVNKLMNAVSRSKCLS